MFKGKSLWIQIGVLIFLLAAVWPVYDHYRVLSDQSAWAQNIPATGGSILSGQTVGTANAAASVALASNANQYIHIYYIEGSCSGSFGANQAASSTTQLNILDYTTSTAFTTVYTSSWASSTNNSIGAPAQFSKAFSPPWTIAKGDGGAVSISACGANSTGTISVQADRY